MMRLSSRRWVPVQLDEAQKKEALSGALGKLVVTDDLELSTEERLDKFYAWLQKYKEQSNYIAKAKEVRLYALFGENHLSRRSSMRRYVWM